jgi:hypothetical protein
MVLEICLCCTETLYLNSVARPRASGGGGVISEGMFSECQKISRLKVLSQEAGRTGEECVMELLEFLRVVMNLSEAVSISGIKTWIMSEM